MDNPKAEVIRLTTHTLYFHAQQAIEKLFKGFMVAHGITISKTHDLSKLLTNISQLAPDLLAYESILEDISEYSVSMRYPDLFYEPPIDETRRAYETAKEIRQVIVKKLAQYI